jgi:monoamine oxidase
MLETAIVGGGLGGLALAAHLHRCGKDFAVFEARQRYGGRILSYDCKLSGLAVDLGASWFWPETQPLMVALLSELGLSSFAQHDDGAALRLDDADKKPEKIDVAGGVHGGAHRVVGGAQKIVDRLRRDLPPDRLHPENVLTAIRAENDHVVLTFDRGGETVEVAARRVVLALPPRLADERIAFAPALDDATRQAMIGAPTWMAQQAKAVAAFDRPLWRAAGESGNAFVTHEQAVLGEIFDASDETASKGALGGFLALGPDQREAFQDGLPLLLESQFQQVFGSRATGGEHYYQDWASEGETCSALDREKGAEEHQLMANPMLRRSLWAGKLFLAGAETGERQAGYMEGALEAARRVARDILRESTGEASPSPLASDAPEAINAASLSRFAAWVEERGDALFDDYRRRLTLRLAAQDKAQLTQIAMLGAAEAFFGDALIRLEALPFDLTGVAVEKGCSALTPLAQKPFGEVLRQFFDDVVAFNQTSCALSNFPDEHHIAKEYRQAIMRDIAAAWTEFSLNANRALLAKGETGRSSARAQA